MCYICIEQKAELLKEFRAKGCWVCSSHENLTAHHIYGPSKSFKVGSAHNKLNISVEAYRAELEKCVCLCRICHDKVHGCEPVGDKKPISPSNQRTRKRREQRQRAKLRRQ